MYIIIISWKTAINGNPYLNATCFVLCRNKIIPIVIPRPLPNIAMVHNVVSEMRYFLFIARRLSINMKINPIKLIPRKILNTIFNLNHSHNYLDLNLYLFNYNETN